MASEACFCSLQSRLLIELFFQIWALNVAESLKFSSLSLTL